MGTTEDPGYAATSTEAAPTTQPPTTGVENGGKECWWKCRRKEGPCSWCGDEGMCCRQGWTGNGCDGNVGGPHNHQCSKAPEDTATDTDSSSDVKNEGKDCWRGCGRKEGKGSWSGGNGMCCRRGWVGNGCDGKIGGPRNHQCTAAPEDTGTDTETSTGLQNKGKDCWWGCGRRQGECSWCGDGMCCRLGWTGNGCDGKMGEAGKGHVCTGKSETGKDSGTGTDTSSGVQNEGIDCWNGCGRRQGECAWCGDG